MLGRRALAFLCVIGILAGAVFALQGFQLLPSRLMYGKPEWIAIGAAMVAASVAVLVWLGARRRPRA